jgi:N-acetylglutamate synthase-like GNAT family acetyltransferase
VHLGVEADGEIVAVATLVPEGGPGAWRLRGMATAPDARGRGHGVALLDACVEEAAGLGARELWCNARTGAASFYARRGFQTVGGEFDVPGIGPHVRMRRLV